MVCSLWGMVGFRSARARRCRTSMWHVSHLVAEAAFPMPCGWTTSTLSTQHSVGSLLLSSLCPWSTDPRDSETERARLSEHSRTCSVPPLLSLHLLAEGQKRKQCLQLMFWDVLVYGLQSWALTPSSVQGNSRVRSRREGHLPVCLCELCLLAPPIMGWWAATNTAHLPNGYNSKPPQEEQCR